jgi:adenosylhomocysteine nucleosidase
MAWQMLVRSWVRDELLKQLRASPLVGNHLPAASDPNEPCRIAIQFALHEEAGGIVDRLKEVRTTRAGGFTLHQGRLADRRVIVAESGVGRPSATNAAEAIIDVHRPALFISTGFAAGLRDGQSRGELIVASEVVCESGELLALDLEPSVNPVDKQVGMHVGRLLTVDQLIDDPSEKRRLAASTGAIALDMETFAVAGVCRRTATPFISIRVISDGVNDCLPREVGRLLRQKTLAGKLGALTGAVLSRPSSVKDFYQLKEGALVASDRLADMLESIVQELPPCRSDEPEMNE